MKDKLHKIEGWVIMYVYIISTRIQVWALQHASPDAVRNSLMRENQRLNTNRATGRQVHLRTIR